MLLPRCMCNFKKSSEPIKMSDQFDVMFKRIFSFSDVFKTIGAWDFPPDDASIGPEGVLLRVDLPGIPGGGFDFSGTSVGEKPS